MNRVPPLPPFGHPLLRFGAEERAGRGGAPPVSWSEKPAFLFQIRRAGSTTSILSVRRPGKISSDGLPRDHRHRGAGGGDLG